jgi:hypothetical protein
VATKLSLPPMVKPPPKLSSIYVNALIALNGLSAFAPFNGAYGGACIA